MAVLPGLQREGIGRWSMHHTESLAREWGAQALRLDAFVGPAGAGAFYLKCGIWSITRRPWAEVRSLPRRDLAMGSAGRVEAAWKW
jgi:GNAT superfamily N-acetyltransferase